MVKHVGQRVAIEDAGDGVFRKITGDLGAKGLAVPEAELRARMNELMLQAIVQVKAGK